MFHFHLLLCLSRLKISKFSALFGLLALMAVAVLPGCRQGGDPLPSFEMSEAQRVRDLDYFVGIISAQYAPLDYKAKLRGKASGDAWLAELAETYTARARAARSNQEFYDLLREFISEFQDAHMSVSLPRSNDLRGLNTISFLGFSGERMGDNLLVTDIFPSSYQSTGFQIMPGDQVTEVDGMPIAEYARQKLFKFRDLGNDLSNLTMHMPAVVVRDSTRNGIEPVADVVLTIKRGNDVFRRTLRWTQLDISDFRLLQERAQADLKKAKDQPVTEVVVQNRQRTNETPLLVRVRDQFNKIFVMNKAVFDAEGIRSTPIASHLRKYLKWLGAFAVPSEPTRLEIVATDGSGEGEGEDEKQKTPMQRLKEERYVPGNARTVAAAKTFPAWIKEIPEVDQAGARTGAQKKIGYIRIDTFSPEAQEAQVLAEFEATLSTFQSEGVQDLVLDTMHNGGGSLSLLYKLAQLLSGEKLAGQKLKFGVMETWYRDMSRAMEFGDGTGNDSERAYARQIYDAMKMARARGERITDAIEIERLLPGQLLPNPKIDQATKPFRLVVLVDEMCASAADMFAHTVRENGMGVLVGKQTMGAGGNVVSPRRDQAPTSHAVLNLTQSLVVTPSGVHVENNGAPVDHDVDHSLFVQTKYRESILTAMALHATQGVYDDMVKPNLALREVNRKNVPDCVQFL